MRIVYSVLAKPVNRVFAKACLFALLLCSVSGVVANQTLDGSVELEQRLFWKESPNPELQLGQTSLRLELELFKDWNDGNDQLIFEPFARFDAVDEERSHLDIRQLIWTRLADNWELSAGIGHVFWGVTESQHLVDIINQTDFVENIDGEDKLGQPMLRYSYFHKNGNLDLYLLPYFRTRTFPGEDSRLAGGIVVDNDNEIFESSDEEQHLDYAIRYSNTFGSVGLGLSWFSGTNREPDLVRLFNPATLSTTPYYSQIDQFAADIQVTTDAWLFKLEAIQRNHDDALIEDFAAATAGVEYTFVGVFGSIYDLGVLAEYSWDERKERSTSLFQNDLFVGARLALNDISDSEVLFGVANDLDDSDSRSIFVEAATRINSTLTTNIELRYFESDNPQDLLFRFRDDSFIQVGLEYYF